MSPRDIRLVVNTSPLIHLAEADLLHLKYTGRKRPIERLLANIGGALQRALG